jgi:hypothetical protein
MPVSGFSFDSFGISPFGSPSDETPTAELYPGNCPGSFPFSTPATAAQLYPGGYPGSFPRVAE